MKRCMIRLALVFLVLFLISLFFRFTVGGGLWETLCITFAVTAYHFWMRLGVGQLLDHTLQNNVDYTKPWFRPRRFEPFLYRTIRVKKWKNHMPTYEAAYFDIRTHSITEIIKAGCQAEIVHEIIIVLSFLPVGLAFWFRPAGVFLATSFLSALVDSLFVIMQRYNRPRLLKLVSR